MDNRIESFADMIVGYSLGVMPGDRVYIDYSGNETRPFIQSLIRRIYAAGAQPFPHRMEPWEERELILGAGREQLKTAADNVIALMEQMDCYIGVRSVENSAELSGIPAERMQLWNSVYAMPIAGVRCAKTRWVVMRYPSPAAAQAMDMGTDAYEDFYYQACAMDYKKMAEAIGPLQELMDRTDTVRIVGPGTDLRFSIKGIGSVPCAGHCNIPDGELYTAPVRDSVNGVITYNTPAPFDGFCFEHICLHFENGRIVQAEANDSSRLNSYLDQDEGARYIGEFALGFNPYIKVPVKNVLFDEKICGSFHFTPGMSYKGPGGNGNESVIHWDLVCIQTPEYGGGEIWFDDVLIRKDGRFVLPELFPLNPDMLGQN